MKTKREKRQVVMKKPAFLTLIVSAALVAAASRNHIEIMTVEDEPGLQAGGSKTEGVTLWATHDMEINVEFVDGTMISVYGSDVFADAVDVYVAGKLTHTCMFKTPTQLFGNLLIIIKDRHMVKIAESADSSCYAARTPPTSITRRTVKDRPLRPALLRRMAQRSGDLRYNRQPKKRVRFA